MAEPDARQSHERTTPSAQRIATVYAEALLNAAAKAGEEQRVLQELDSLIDDLFQADPRLEILLSGAAVGRYHRQASLDKALSGRASDTLVNFLQVLNNHERLELLRSIRFAAREMHDQRERRLRVYVATAVPLPDDIRQRLEEGVRTSFNLEPVLLTSVDPELLGGMKVRIGDILYDATVQTKLMNLRNQILSRGNHEIQSRRDRFSTANGN
jgi:F-type H+-transporting ATPase subunit delta